MMLEQEQMFKGFIGQTFLKNMLYDMYACNTKQFPHTLFIASPGQGKTKLSRLLAKALNTNFVETYGPSIKNWDEMRNVLKQLNQERFVLFIDEVHGLPQDVQEMLYPILTDYAYYDKKSCKYEPVGKFTLIGATTDPQYLLRPFFDRFTNTMVFHKYTTEDIKEMFRAQCNEQYFDPQVVDKIITLSHNVPRKLNAMLTRLDYFVGSHNIQFVDMPSFSEFMKHIGLDDRGFNPLQQQYVNILRKANSPVSLATLANLMELKQEVISNIVEPDIIATGAVCVSSSGRKWRDL